MAPARFRLSSPTERWVATLPVQSSRSGAARLHTTNGAGSWGLEPEQLKQLKDFEAENARLLRAVAGLTLDELVLQAAAVLVPMATSDIADVAFGLRV